MGRTRVLYRPTGNKCSTDDLTLTRRLTDGMQMRRYDVRFVLKADDDAFINVPSLVRELKAQCLSFGCRKERMYFGREIRNNLVRVAAGDKWQVTRACCLTALTTRSQCIGATVSRRRSCCAHPTQCYTECEPAVMLWASGSLPAQATCTALPWGAAATNAEHPSPVVALLKHDVLLWKATLST